MKAEEKVAEAMHRLTETEAKARRLNDELDKANTEITKANDELLRVFHSVFGTKDKQVIYDNILWTYNAEDCTVGRKEWDGVIIGNGKDPKAS